MKKKFNKRKHRNGKKPQRKGSIKINLTDLPDYFELTDIWLKRRQKDIDLSWQLPRMPMLYIDYNGNAVAWQKAFVEYEKKMAKRQRAIQSTKNVDEKIRKAMSFISDFDQVDPESIAIDAIAESQPRATIFFEVDTFCDQCKRKNKCPLMKLEWRERAETCKKLIKAYDNFCDEVDNGTFRRPMDYSVNYQNFLAEAWEIQLS